MQSIFQQCMCQRFPFASFTIFIIVRKHSNICYKRTECYAAETPTYIFHTQDIIPVLISIC